MSRSGPNSSPYFIFINPEKINSEKASQNDPPPPFPLNLLLSKQRGRVVGSLILRSTVPGSKMHSLQSNWFAWSQLRFLKVVLFCYSTSMFHIGSTLKILIRLKPDDFTGQWVNHNLNTDNFLVSKGWA